MFFQLDNPANYDSNQQLATQVAILHGKLKMMRLDHPDRESTLTEFTTLQAQLTLARQGVERFGPQGFTF